MIARIWTGRTSSANADTYERTVLQEVFPSIERRAIEGLHLPLRLLRREISGEETEFMTIMTFSDLAAVRMFAGPGLGNAVLPEPARSLLSNYDQEATHFVVITEAS